MGSCVSVHKDPESALKLRFSIEPKNDSVLIPSPVKERSEAVNGGDRTVGELVLKSQPSPARFVGAGSKDEGFFDSQPWLESDCEDDFFSVNGDFTPSHGNTPVHHSFALANRGATNARAVESMAGPIPEPSPPPDKKKRLSELFKESLRGSKDYADQDPSKVAGAESTSLIQRPKSMGGTPTSPELTQGRVAKGLPTVSRETKTSH